MVKCKKNKTLIPLSFYKELSGKESEKFHRHLNTCNECRQEYRSTASMLVGIPRNSKVMLGKNEYDILEEKVKESITNRKRKNCLPKKSSLSLSYIIIMLVLFISSIFVVKNFQFKKNIDLNSSHRFPTSIVYPKEDMETRVRYFLSGNPSGSGGYSEEASYDEMLLIIRNLVSTIYGDKNDEVRKSAVGALALIGTPYALEMLIEISKNHPDPQIRIKAVGCLARYAKYNYERRHSREM